MINILKFVLNLIQLIRQLYGCFCHLLYTVAKNY